MATAPLIIELSGHCLMLAMTQESGNSVSLQPWGGGGGRARDNSPILPKMLTSPERLNASHPVHTTSHSTDQDENSATFLQNPHRAHCAPVAPTNVEMSADVWSLPAWTGIATVWMLDALGLSMGLLGGRA